MASNTNNAGIVALIIVIAVLAFAGGYYYYKDKDERTLTLDLGGKEISATVDDK